MSNLSDPQRIQKALNEGKAYHVKRAGDYSVGSMLKKGNWYYSLNGPVNNIHGLHVICFDAASRSKYNKANPDKPIKGFRDFESARKHLYGFKLDSKK